MKKTILSTSLVFIFILELIILTNSSNAIDLREGEQWVFLRDGGCWSYSKSDRICYFINNETECQEGCPDDLVCNLNYDWDSIDRETLDYCHNVSTSTNNTNEVNTSTYIPFKGDTPSISKKPPRSQLEMFFGYSYLRFKENVINKIFFGSWILFFILLFVVSYLIVYLIKKTKKYIKKRKNKEKREF